MSIVYPDFHNLKGPGVRKIATEKSHLLIFILDYKTYWTNFESSAFEVDQSNVKYHHVGSPIKT